MAVTAIKTKNAVEPLRDIVQDLLVPELKAVKIELSSLRNEMTVGFDSIRTEMRIRDEKQTQAINHLAENLSEQSKKLDHTLEIRERLAALEALSPKNR